MNYLLNLLILIVGLSGIVAQVLLLRELLIGFLGNELTLGIILANWVILEAAGVFVIGKLIDRIKNKINTFITLEIIFCLMLPVSIYLCRVFKDILGVPYGGAVGLYTIFYSSFFIILPLAFCHGALFSAGCKIHYLQIKESIGSIGSVYFWETLGTIFGGIALTYLFIPYLNSFKIVFLISIANLVVCLFLFRYITEPKLKYTIVGFITFIVFLFLNGDWDILDSYSVDRQWRKTEVLEYNNSVYGNITVTRQPGQYTFIYNGIPVIATPNPDITFVEELGHLPLLFHRNPKEVLIISAGAGGIINEALKHGIEGLDYVELDPLIIKMLEKYHTPLTDAELKDRRTNIINLDGRYFLKTTPRKYDVVLIGLSKPADLSTNRLFTEEFFHLVKTRLTSGGILAFWLPGSLTYLSRELRDLNACISNGLKAIFKYTRVIPGDYNIFLASSSNDVNAVTPALISKRIVEQNIKTNILLPGYINYRLDKRWTDWYLQSSRGATPKVNKDLTPYAVFEMLIFWNKQFSPKLALFLESLQDLNLKQIAIFVFIITLLIFFLLHSRPKLRKLNIAYCIFTTGFFAMLVNLILIFAFQVFYGYLYHMIGMLISIFMAGIALGSITMTRKINRIRGYMRLFIALEILILMFSFILPWAIIKFVELYAVLFLVSGFLIGAEFPLANKIYLEDKNKIGLTVGLLYAVDLTGGWCAGILGGIIFLPILGLLNTCIVIALLKLSSLIILVFYGEKFKLT